MDISNSGNLNDDDAAPAHGERLDTLLQHRNMVIERIISAADFASDTMVQTQDEWVLLAQGTAVLDINGKSRKLRSGDYVFLPAGTPHRVVHTSAGALWLAVHLHPA